MVKSRKKFSDPVPQPVQKAIKRIHRGIWKSISDKKPSKQLSTGLLRSFSGQGQRQSQSQSQGQRPVGRPRGDYKHRDPKTGQPIPATVFYKRIKEVKREAGQMSQMARMQQIQELAKRGIHPSQASQIVDTRTDQRVQTKLQPQVQQVQPQSQQRQPQPVQRQNIMASQVPRNIPRYGERRVFIEADLFGNPREKVSNDETSFWN